MIVFVVVFVTLPVNNENATFPFVLMVREDPLISKCRRFAGFGSAFLTVLFAGLTVALCLFACLCFFVTVMAEIRSIKLRRENELFLSAPSNRLRGYL